MKKIIWLGLAAITAYFSAKAIKKHAEKKMQDMPATVSEEKRSRTVASAPKKTVSKPRRRTPRDTKINPKDVLM